MIIVGTQITMGDESTKNVEIVRPNDILKSYNGGNITVQNLVRGHGDEHYVINNRLKITGEHQILLLVTINADGPNGDAGATTYEKRVQVQDVQVGDNLIKSDGTTETVTSITTVLGQLLTFNFTSDGNHLYIAEDIVVRC